MSKDVRNRPTVPCKGYWNYDHQVNCGNTLYEMGYSTEDARNAEETLRPIWRCTNCQVETPRHSRKRESLAMKRWDVIKEIKTAWQATEDALHLIVARRQCPSGCLLVHGLTFNYHVEKLRSLDKITRRDLAYHTARAYEDLEKAKRFVTEMECVAW